MLTDPVFIRKLEMLRLLARKVLGGSLKADRKSNKKGSGILFADHAEYYFGDDYRNIDWNVYARLESLVVKLFELEEDICIYLLIDMSRSMASKILFAKQLAAALGYIGLCNADRVTIYGFAHTLQPVMEKCSGKGQTFPMLKLLQKAECFGTDTSFSESIRNFQGKYKKQGVYVIISDFFMARGYSDGLKFLRWNKNDIYVIQTVTKDELTCDLKGDIRLQCVETGSRRLVTVGPLEAAQYVKAIKKWNKDLERTCMQYGIGYTRATVDIPFEQVIQLILRRGGLVA